VSPTPQVPWPLHTSFVAVAQALGIAPVSHLVPLHPSSHVQAPPVPVLTIKPSFTQAPWWLQILIGLLPAATTCWH